jgi:hypothetical protein
MTQWHENSPGHKRASTAGCWLAAEFTSTAAAAAAMSAARSRDHCCSTACTCMTANSFILLLLLLLLLEIELAAPVAAHLHEGELLLLPHRAQPAAHLHLLPNMQRITAARRGSLAVAQTRNGTAAMG